MKRFFYFGRLFLLIPCLLAFIPANLPAADNRLVIVRMFAPEYVEKLSTFQLLLSVSDTKGIQEVMVRFGVQERIIPVKGQTFASLAIDLSSPELGVFTLEAVGVGVDGARGAPAKTQVTVGSRPGPASALNMDEATLRRRIAEWKLKGLTPFEPYKRGSLYKKAKFKRDYWWILDRYPVPKHYLNKYGKFFNQQDWWRKWQELGGGQPFDWKKYCGKGGITPNGEVLNCWLDHNPSVKASLVWEVVHLESGTVFPEPYYNWTEEWKKELYWDFYASWVWLNSGLMVPLASPPDPSINMIPPDSWTDWVALNPQQARVLYMATVAHSLALEIGGFVPWSVLNYNQEDLRQLFSSSAMFYAGEQYYLDRNHETQYYTGYFPESIVPAYPQKSFRFFVDQDIIRPTHYGTITRLLGWSGEHLNHYGDWGDLEGKTPMEQAYMYWQYYGGNPVARMLDGTVRENTDKPWSWTVGCSGTSHMYVSILRALNIPAYAQFGGITEPPFLYGHHTSLFTTIGKALSHADDMLHFNWFVEDFLPPPSYISPAELFISWDTYLDWFYDHQKFSNLSRQIDEIELKFLHNDVLNLYCTDLLMQFPPWESYVYGRFAVHHSLAELENMDLWGRLAEKEQSLNYCNIYWQ
jgi:hypothetical protein